LRAKRTKSKCEMHIFYIFLSNTVLSMVPIKKIHEIKCAALLEKGLGLPFLINIFNFMMLMKDFFYLLEMC
jgi:hypothetical protein